MIDQILQMPPIAQSVIGSAIFAICLLILKICYTFFTDKFSHYNKKFYKNKINSELSYCIAMKTGNVEIQSFALIGILYIASIDLIKACICLCLGFLLLNILPIFQEISIMFALYFFLGALNIVNQSKTTGNYEDRVIELETELEKIEQST